MGQGSLFRIAGLNDDVTGVYLYALRTRSIRLEDAAEDLGMARADLKCAVEQLLELKLLRRGTETDSLLPVRPDIAAADFSAPVEERIHAQENQLRMLRAQMLSLLPVYEEQLTETGDRSAVEVFSDADEVRGLLRIAASECREEVVTVQPGGARNHRILAEALPRDIAMLERGVRMRVLYQHTARGDLATRSYVSKIVKCGAEVRTTGQIGERLIIFDRKIAFLPDRPHGDSPPGAAVVRERVVVAYLLRLLDQTWGDATPFDASDLGYQGTVEEVRRSILRLMARGLSDEAVARRMGMALRTCRRHIAAIMQDLGVNSRFQAGIVAQRRCLLDDVTDLGFTESGG